MYSLPETLNEDISRLATLAKDYQDKKIEAVHFKVFRVPMGIYEQRKNEVYMVRIRATGGVIYPEQLLKIIEIAGRYRSDLLHITTRQEIQIQNLELNNVEPVLQELRRIGLSTKGGGGNTVRNIMVSEGSEIASGEVFDTTPYAMALTTKLIAEPDSFLLPRKMKIAFSSGDTQTGYAAINDIGFVAKIRNGERGFQVYAGGGGGSKSTVGWILFDFIPANKFFVVTEALKKFFSEHGNRKNKHKARMRYIFYKLGEAEAIRLIREYCDAVGKTTPLCILPAAEEQRVPFDCAETSVTLDENYELWKKRYVLAQKQEGYYSILVPLLLGNLRLNDKGPHSGIRRLLTFIAQFGEHTVRFTNSQSIRLRNIPSVALQELYGILKGMIPDCHAPVLTNQIIACTGADTCRLGIGLSKGLATAIRRELLRSKLNLDKLATAKIHISGCPNSCGQQIWADIGFSGKILRNERIYPGYQVYLAARRDVKPRLAEPVGNISARDIPAFVCRLLTAYLNSATVYPSLTAFLETAGKTKAAKLLEEYRDVPSFEEDKNYYYDWEADTLFSIVDRGAAECSAGLFDMIDVDQNSINANITALETEMDNQRTNRLLYEILFASSRMLLVTRGAEPKTTSDVFNLFIGNFIEFGIVDGCFRDIVSLARDNQEYDFSKRREEIFALASAVTELYKNMDDSLQFKNANIHKPETETPKQPDADRKFGDLRGVACPMNFVKTKILLSTMQSEKELEIWLDDGLPIANVPGSVRNEGHEILEQTQIGNHWKVVIRKK
ncbi:MAG: sulfurtransferase TusA family protein [Tannerella sp.]|jgi:sulfite reductase (ferredoxin)|nr:sulfurtransferase TusA family protein [Tannerella sp.]